MAWQSWDFSTSNSTLIDGANIYTGSILGSSIAANTITGNNLKAGSIDVTNLNFTPLASTNVIACINASSESLLIAANKLDISGLVTFSTYGASADQTKIDGGKIYAGSIQADSLAAGSVTAEKLTIGSATRVNLCANGHFGTYNTYGTSYNGWALGANAMFIAAYGTYTPRNGTALAVPGFKTTTASSIVAEQYITVLPNTTYTVVALVFIDSNATSAYVRVVTVDGNTRISNDTSGVTAGTKVPDFYGGATYPSNAADTTTVKNSWQLIAYKITTPANASQVRLQIGLSGTAGTAAVFVTGVQMYADTMNEAGTSLDGISQLKGIAYGGDVSGSYSALSVRALQGRLLSTTAPADTQVLAWSTSSNAWLPTSLEQLLTSKSVSAVSFSGAGTGLTGTAAGLTAGSANAVAWSNVSGRPTQVSSFTNDAGYISGINSTQVVTALSYTPVNKAGDTLTGTFAITGGLSVTGTMSMYDTSSGSSWLSQRDATTVALRDYNAVAGNYKAFVQAKGSDYTFTMGRLSNIQIGFYGYTNTRTGNGTDYSAWLDYTNTWNCGGLSSNGGRLVLCNNSIEDSATSGKSDIAINYNGYAGSTAYFRDFNVYNGKHVLIANFSGSDNYLDLTGPLVTRARLDGMLKIKDVAFYRTDYSSSTGTIKITLPKSWTNTMLRVTIDGYDFSGNGAWQVVVSGYTYAGTPSWNNARYYTSGQPPFSTVRLAHDGTYCCILLGNTSTSLEYPKISVSDVMLGHSNFDATWASGWSITQITSESGLSCITTPGKLTSSFGAINTSPAGVSPNPYGFISVTLPADTNSYGYYSLTRAGQYAWQMGIDTSNRFVIGGGSSGNTGVITNSLFLIAASTTTVNNNLQVNGTITGVGSGLTGTAASLTAGAVSSITGNQVFDAILAGNNPDWYRTAGQKGIYFAAYSAGFHATASQYIQTFNNSSLQVNGAIYSTGNITAYYSDGRLKENIKVIPNALDKVLSLRGVTFNANAKAVEVGYTDTSEQVGVIAQEVQAVLPQVVTYAPFDRVMEEDGKNTHSKSGEDYLTVRYDRMVPLLIEAIKELNAKIEGKQ